jgi:hypothetical protein
MIDRSARYLLVSVRAQFFYIPAFYIFTDLAQV